MNWKITGKTHVFEGFKFQWVDHCLMFFDDMFECFCSDVFFDSLDKGGMSLAYVWTCFQVDNGA